MNSSLFRGIIYMSLGATAEMMFTALKDWPRLQGNSQMWVLPLYFFGGLFVFEPLFYLLAGLSTILKLIVYSSIILLIEWLAGWGLDRWLGVVPWRYERGFLIESNYIRLEYAPLWAAVGLLGELVFFYLTTCNN